MKHTCFWMTVITLTFGALTTGALAGDQSSGQLQLLSSHGTNAGQVEHYLSEKQLDFLRPGINVTIEDYGLTPGGDLWVELTMKDDYGQPLDRAGILTPGSISVSFIFAVYNDETRDYYAYTKRTADSSNSGMSAEQASSDSGGTWEDIELGRARYTFGTQVPADIEMDKTHTIAFYATRDLNDFIGKRIYDNQEFDFRPDGGTVTAQWDAVANETCNNCHDPLALHGGSRQDVKLCVTCHSAQSIDPDTGNTVDMKVMIHKIHRGEGLPSVEAGMPYQIIGYRNSVHDYSDVVYPANVMNCQSCHKPESAEGNIWYTRPSRRACGACHDNIDWVTGEGHGPGPQMDDSACANCHIPEGETEFDVSIMGAHTIPTKSKQLEGLHVNVMDVVDTMPGMTPTITFRISDDAGTSIDPSVLDSARFRLGGPNSDITHFIQENVGTAAWDGDTAEYTFENAIPEDASGSWTVGGDFYRFVTISEGTEDEQEVREAAFNPNYTFAVTDSEPIPRRDIVSLDSCNSCHDTLALHGGQRFAIRDCVVCHNPVENDHEVRPEEEMPAQSIHFKWMIHRIHTGEELNYDFTVYGFRGSLHNYNELLYPGDLRNCEACHIPGTYGLPLPDGAEDTITERDFYTPMGPATSACLSCHDTQDAAAHAFVNTAPFGESCAACHGDDREFSVQKIHAR